MSGLARGHATNRTSRPQPYVGGIRQCSQLNNAKPLVNLRSHFLPRGYLLIQPLAQAWAGTGSKDSLEHIFWRFCDPFLPRSAFSKSVCTIKNATGSRANPSSGFLLPGEGLNDSLGDIKNALRVLFGVKMLATIRGVLIAPSGIFPPHARSARQPPRAWCSIAGVDSGGDALSRENASTGRRTHTCRGGFSRPRRSQDGSAPVRRPRMKVP